MAQVFSAEPLPRVDQEGCPSCGGPVHESNEECWFDDLGTCPYYARWCNAPGHDPEATCGFGCRDEPECVTCRPWGGWPSERLT